MQTDTLLLWATNVWVNVTLETFLWGIFDSLHREIRYRKCKSCQSSENGGTYPSAKPLTSIREASPLSPNDNYSSSDSGSNYANVQNTISF